MWLGMFIQMQKDNIIHVYGSMFKLSAENHVVYITVTYYMAKNDPHYFYGILKRSSDNNTYVGQIPGAKTLYTTWEKRTGKMPK